MNVLWFAEQICLIFRLIFKVRGKEEAQGNKVFKSKKSNYGIMRIRT